MKWFRFYHEFMDDPKVAMMGDADQLLWVKTLCLASENNQRGYIFLSDDEICWRLRITHQVWKHAIDKFRAKGMIEHCQGGYRIVNWDKRQYESDSSSKRVAKHRFNKAKAEQCNVTPNVSETELKHPCNVTDSECNVTPNVSETLGVTPPDTDTESDPDPDPDQKIKDPPLPPQGDGVLKNFQNGPPENLQTVVKAEEGGPTGSDFPQTKSNSGQSNPKLEGQYSGPRRESSKAIRNIKREYQNGPPDWRYGYGSGEYHPEFEADIQATYLDRLPETSLRKHYTPAQTIEEAEAAGNWANLQSRCKAWLDRAKRQAAQAVPAPPPPPPPQATPNAIAKLMQTLSLFPDDVLSTMRQLHPLCFNTLPKDPLEAWQRIGPGQRPLIHAYLLEQHAHAIPA